MVLALHNTWSCCFQVKTSTQTNDSHVSQLTNLKKNYRGCRIAHYSQVSLRKITKDGKLFLSLWILLWTHCQHLLWMGSDPLLTLLLFDWFGSKVIEGAGAIFSCVCRSCISASLSIREFLRKNNLPPPHLRARSILLRAETSSGWIDKNPIQRIRTITLQEGHNIFLHFGGQQKEQKCFLGWGYDEKIRGLSVATLSISCTECLYI